MVCQICGKEAAEGSKYCQRCGSKLSNVGIDKNLLIKKILEGKMAGSKSCETYIDRIRYMRYRNVRIIKSTFDGMNLSNYIMEKNGDLCIICPEEEMVSLISGFIINEIDSLNNSITEISTKIHDDRVAHIEAAVFQFKRAKLTVNEVSRRYAMEFAAQECITGLTMIKKELVRHLDFFEQLPKSTIKKMFCGASVNQAEEMLAQFQEAFPIYATGVNLLLEIDSFVGENQRIRMTFHDATDFLKGILASKGYDRLMEIDDENTDKWKDGIESFLIDMYYVSGYLGKNEIVLKIKEDER